MEIDAMENLKKLENVVDQAIESAERRGFISGEVSGAVKVLRLLELDKEQSVSLLCDSVGLCEGTATEFYDKYIKV